MAHVCIWCCVPGLEAHCVISLELVYCIRSFGWPWGHLERRMLPTTTWGRMGRRGIVTTTCYVYAQQFPFACGPSKPATPLWVDLFVQFTVV